MIWKPVYKVKYCCFAYFKVTIQNIFFTEGLGFLFQKPSQVKSERSEQGKNVDFQSIGTTLIQK